MISGEIRRFLRDDGMIKVSRSLRELSYKSLQAREKLTRILGREPTLKELSEEFQIDCEEIVQAMESSVEVESIYKPIHQKEGSEILLMDKLEEKDRQEEKVLDRIVLKEILESNILVISKKGKVLGTGVLQGVEEINELIVDEVGGFIDPLLNERLLGILSTKENVNLETLGFVDDVKKYTAIITPIDIAGERLGTLFVYRENRQYDIDDIILSEYGTTVVGLEMMRSVNEENAEETRKVQIVKSAISTLSFSELEAITHIFDEMDGKEGILVASKIADRVGITRSVIVNALRKFESAGVIESRSSGMKGTYIKVLNDVVFDELDKIKKENHKNS